VKNVSLAEWFNSSKENANDEDDKGPLHTGVHGMFKRYIVRELYPLILAALQDCMPTT